MAYTNHLYVILHPNPSLVLSQLEPQEFALHYVSGSTRYYDGKLIFSEIDINYRNDFFPIDQALEQLVPHSDGTPKATKFVSIYRVLEHIDVTTIKKLYLSTPDAALLELEASNEDLSSSKPGALRVFAEITPLKMLVMTKLGFAEFGKAITKTDDPLRFVPMLFYTQLEFDTEAFLVDFERNPLMQSPIPGLHPNKLRDAISELKAVDSKISKVLALDSSFNRIPYRYVKHGFIFSAGEKHVYFKMPTIREVEEKNYRFWKGM
ncbi:MAG: hypothetical protein D6B26_04640 [Spirochaetaceae bacterium]|nr:MAG: hypothetical protein D6B26_04640 [Spirochaetaceae bacterium]